jgi:hypothetical protein
VAVKIITVRLMMTGLTIKNAEETIMSERGRIKLRRMLLRDSEKS